MCVSVQLTFDVREASDLYAPIGLSSPAGTCNGVQVKGAHMALCHEIHGGHAVLKLTPVVPELKLTYRFRPDPSDYPDSVFAPRDTRFNKAAAALATNAAEVAENGGVAAVVAYLVEIFDYGSQSLQFSNEQDVMPQLYDRETGICVDMNAYFVAALRSAGIEAGEVFGYHFASGRSHEAGTSHGWVVTREGGKIQHWDIAHHLMANRRDIAPVLNPMGGVRVAVSHSTGWQLDDQTKPLNHIAAPLWKRADGGWEESRFETQITGYDALEAVQNPAGSVAIVASA